MPDRNIGNLPEMLAGEVSASEDRFVLWDDSATGIDRTKSITVSELQTLLAITSGNEPIRIPFAWGDASPKPIITALAGQTVFTVQIVITTAMLAGSTLSLGDAANPNRLMAATQLDPSIVSEFEANPGYTYTADTQIILTINPAGGNTTGAGFVLIEV